MIEAILFDFYDTLVYRDETVTAAVRAAVADLLAVRPDELAATWRRYRDDRMLGIIPTLEDHLRVVVRDLGRQPPPGAIAAAARLEREGQRRAVRPYPATASVLAELRRAGFRLGLLSNSSDTAQEPIWGLGIGQLFDAVVLSHEVGLLKPDPRIYRLACERVGALPSECAFVADGGFGELDAAHDLGMLAIKIEQQGQSKDYGSSTYCDLCLSDLRDLVAVAAGWRRSRGEGGE